MSKKTKKKKAIKPLTHRKNWAKYPSFTYPQKESEIAYVPQGFIDIVKEAVRSFDFESNDIFDSEQRKVCRDMKKTGFGMAISEKYGQSSAMGASLTWFVVLYTEKIGQFICDYIKNKGESEGYFPYCNYRVAIEGEGKIFTVLFDALLSRSTPSGRMYYPKNMPKITINDEEFKISFSRHAIERISQRTCYEQDYSGLIDTFVHFSNLIEFEPCSLPDGTHAFSFFEPCFYPLFSYQYALNVLGADDKKTKYQYRMGYCPAENFDGFAKAITLLTPGMKGTPEYELFKNSVLGECIRKEIEESIENSICYKQMFETKDFRAIKWFHDNGIPQVLPLTGEQFPSMV